MAHRYHSSRNKCSNCNGTVPDENFKFCPFCGAPYSPIDLEGDLNIYVKKDDIKAETADEKRIRIGKLGKQTLIILLLTIAPLLITYLVGINIKDKAGYDLVYNRLGVWSPILFSFGYWIMFCSTIKQLVMELLIKRVEAVESRRLYFKFFYIAVFLLYCGLIHGWMTTFMEIIHNAKVLLGL